MIDARDLSADTSTVIASVLAIDSFHYAGPNAMMLAQLRKASEMDDISESEIIRKSQELYVSHGGKCPKKNGVGGD
jgi:hypothetical protein